MPKGVRVTLQDLPPQAGWYALNDVSSTDTEVYGCMNCYNGPGGWIGEANPRNPGNKQYKDCDYWTRVKENAIRFHDETRTKRKQPVFGARDYPETMMSIAYDMIHTKKGAEATFSDKDTRAVIGGLVMNFPEATKFHAITVGGYRDTLYTKWEDKYGWLSGVRNQAIYQCQEKCERMKSRVSHIVGKDPLVSTFGGEIDDAEWGTIQDHLMTCFDTFRKARTISGAIDTRYQDHDE